MARQQDMTMRRKAQQEARRLRERLWQVSRLATVGELTAAIAHEVNQPLAAIATYAQACDRLLGRPDADADVEEIHGALREMAAQAVRAGDGIRKLRALACRHVEEREPTDINELVAEVVEIARLDFMNPNVELQLQLGEGLPAVEVRRAPIQQVLLNLLRNALESFEDAAPSTQEVVVRTSHDHRAELEISVSDNGPGVPGEIAPHIFDPLFSTKPAGTGLGLAISQSIVREHRGTLSYRPNVPVGACFIVRLPLYHGPQP
jgi:two-component system, LuxR family, sensor kinase FixL